MKITISGTPGSGKSTIAKMLASKLGYKHYSAGDFMRELAKEKGLSLEEISVKAETDGGEIDKEIDKRSSELGKSEDNFVMDTRLGFHFIPDSFKIRLIVDERVGAERIIKDDRSDEGFRNTDEAISEIRKRVESERKRYEQYYGINKDDAKNFDLVIDTSSLTPEEIVEKLLQAKNQNL